MANPTDNPSYVLNDIITLIVELQLADKQQSRYAELSSSLVMGLKSLKEQLDRDVKQGNPLEESTFKFIEQLELTCKTFTNAKEKAVQLIRAQKEFQPDLQKVSANLANGLQ